MSESAVGEALRLGDSDAAGGAIVESSGLYLGRSRVSLVSIAGVPKNVVLKCRNAQHPGKADEEVPSPTISRDVGVGPVIPALTQDERGDFTGRHAMRVTHTPPPFSAPGSLAI